MRPPRTFRVVGTAIGALLLAAAGLASPAAAAPGTSGTSAPGGSVAAFPPGVVCAVASAGPAVNGADVRFSVTISCEGPVVGIAAEASLFRDGVRVATGPTLPAPGRSVTAMVSTPCVSGDYLGVATYRIFVDPGAGSEFHGVIQSERVSIEC